MVETYRTAKEREDTRDNITDKTEGKQGKAFPKKYGKMLHRQI